MLNVTFGHNTIRRYVVMFGTLFNNIKLQRHDSSGLVQEIKVPLSYAEKDKLLVRVIGDPKLDREVAVVLPRMSFEMTNLSYDGSRKLSKIGRTGRAGRADPTSFNPVPYNLDFNLYIAVRNSEDGTRIVEQILPYFTPDWNVTVNLIEGLNSKLDIPVVLNNVSKEDSYDGDYKNRRAIIWTLTFTIKGYLFGPVTEKKIIETAITKIFDTRASNINEVVRITATEDSIDIEEF